MPGAMSSLAFPNVILNSAVADALGYYADMLERAAEPSETVYKLIRETVRDHKRIVFNGNGYENEWIVEAERRGLSNYRTTPDCVPHLLDEKNVRMLTDQKVFSRSELESRCEIILENYCKTICIEARTMRSMAIKRIAPAVEAYTAELSANMNEKKRALPDLECGFEKEIITELSDRTDRIYGDVQSLISVLNTLSGEDYFRDSEVIRDELLPAMRKLREDGDAAEMLTSKKYWPLPNYGLLMFGEK
jgi:glutamine synthetase